MTRSESLQPLSHDHYQGLITVRRIREMLDEGEDPAEITRFARRFWEEHLRRHFEAEEAHILPALDALGIEGLAARIREEHAAIREQVRGLPPEGARRQALTRLADTLYVHARFEEREVFPALEEQADDETLRAIGEHLHRDEARSGLEPAAWD